MPEAGNVAPDAAPSGAQPGVFNDPYRAYNFKLEIQGITEGHFAACSGLGIKIQVIKYREGGTNQVVHQPARMTAHPSENPCRGIRGLIPGSWCHPR